MPPSRGQGAVVINVVNYFLGNAGVEHSAQIVVRIYQSQRIHLQFVVQQVHPGVGFYDRKG